MRSNAHKNIRQCLLIQYCHAISGRHIVNLKVTVDCRLKKKKKHCLGVIIIDLFLQKCITNIKSWIVFYIEHSATFLL